ncbi:MAG: hypothetical protein U0531_08355 [Dehalococcoidia bacterium]
MEKPLSATRAAEAHELVEIATARGLTPMTGHTFLFHPGGAGAGGAGARRVQQ